jgi:hypothetical protein
MPNEPLSTPDEHARAKLRRGVYALLIAVSVGVMLGRVLALNSVDLVKLEQRLNDERGKKGQPLLQLQRPFLSGNDRSRLLTMRALVERGTYAIDHYVTDPVTHQGWDTIDMVVHKDRAGRAHAYSSKPPLLATLYAAPYWIIHKITGKTLGTNPYEIGRTIIVLVNIVPLVLYFFVLAAIVERYGRTDWGRIFVVAAAAFGTYLTTFAVAINNHLPGALCAVTTLYAVCRIWYDGERHWKYFALAGAAAMGAVTCELPALALFAFVAAGLLWKAPRQTLIVFAPAAAAVAAPYLLTNWLAHGTLKPAYSQRASTLAMQPRDDGQPVVRTPLPDDYADTITLDSGIVLEIRGNESDWYDYEYSRTDGKKTTSYWLSPKGVDRGEPSIGKYAFHLLIGHHGIFSLTPIWLLAIPGVVWLGWNKDYRLRDLAIVISVITIIVLTFYVFRPTRDRNYGGTCSAVRWVFWLAPLWLVAMVPTADRLATCRWGRVLGYALLVMAVLSATYPIWNPWVNPWLTVFWQYMGWG